MSLSEHWTDDPNPIDIVESLAESHDWEFDRLGEDQIAMAVEGQWRTYSITLAWSGGEATLRLIVSFAMEPPADRMAELYEAINLANDGVWTGAFSYWAAEQLMVFRYGLLTAGQGVGAAQVATLVETAVAACERYYPAFQLATWGNGTPEAALQVAIAEAYGRA